MNNSTVVPNELSAAVLFSHIEMSAAMPSLMSVEGEGGWQEGDLFLAGRDLHVSVCLSACLTPRDVFCCLVPTHVRPPFTNLSITNSSSLLLYDVCLMITSGLLMWDFVLREVHIGCAKQHKQLYIFIRVFWLSK